MLFALTTIGGCSTAPSTEASRIVTADEKGIEGCQFMGNVEGSSSYGGLAMQEVGLTRAKNEALDKVADLGGTHIVWQNNAKGFWGASASGKAYKCKN